MHDSLFLVIILAGVPKLWMKVPTQGQRTSRAGSLDASCDNFFAFIESKGPQVFNYPLLKWE